MCVCVCMWWGEWIWENEIPQKAAACSTNLSAWSLQKQGTCFFLAAGISLYCCSLLFLSSGILSWTPCMFTAPLAGLPKLSLANPGVNRLIPWTRVRETLEQVVHLLAKIYYYNTTAGTDYACSWTQSAFHFTNWFKPRVSRIPLVTGA